ncbi:hypothetical protein [Rhodococcus sp. NPDC047139]|uniref:hypothetical protein n=1 Tax=Rhodococcus sp. NPDC047139 TaxID=3155141 RepID=UPI0033C9FF78
MIIKTNPDPLLSGMHGMIEFIPERNQEKDDLIVVVQPVSRSSSRIMSPELFRLPAVTDYDSEEYRTISLMLPYPGIYEVLWKFDADGNYGGIDSPNQFLREFPTGQEIDGRVSLPVIAHDPGKIELVPKSTPGSFQSVLWDLIESISGRLRFEHFIDSANAALAGDCTKDRAGVPVDRWYGTGPYQRLDRAAAAFVEQAADPRWTLHPGPGQDPHEIWNGMGSADAATREGLQASYVNGIRERNDLAKPFLGDFESECWNMPLPTVPMVELIWNYWVEEGMLVQTLNRILARFQNRIVGSGRDPLARFSVNPLLPLRSLMWGIAESERERLTVRRRAAEYEYQYGLHLVGHAVPPRATTVERRTQFLEAFHNLLNATHHFYKEHDDKTVEADAFPLLSSLRELHLVLAYGANNQFADLPLTARREMIVMQCTLAQPEMREFLGGRTMVPYEEGWMDRVDTMKSLQGWSDVSISHFFDLAVHGEKLLLSVRHGRWNDADMDREDAENWALRSRNSVQRYIYAYRSVTGADLSVGVDTTMPSTLLLQRLRNQFTRV